MRSLSSTSVGRRGRHRLAARHRALGHRREVGLAAPGPGASQWPWPPWLLRIPSSSSLHACQVSPWTYPSELEPTEFTVIGTADQTPQRTYGEDPDLSGRRPAGTLRSFCTAPAAPVLRAANYVLRMAGGEYKTKLTGPRARPTMLCLPHFP